MSKVHLHVTVSPEVKQAIEEHVDGWIFRDRSAVSEMVFRCFFGFELPEWVSAPDGFKGRKHNIHGRIKMAKKDYKKKKKELLDKFVEIAKNSKRKPQSLAKTWSRDVAPHQGITLTEKDFLTHYKKNGHK